MSVALRITLNGEPYDLAAPLTVHELLAQLQIDSRRVAVEHNLTVVKREAFDRTTVNDGDEIEIVNFVGGGEFNAECGMRNAMKRRMQESGNGSFENCG